MATPERPLSPHLQVYRPQLTSMMSIAHRGTGVLLAIGALVFALWLNAVASDGACFAWFQQAFATLLGKIFLFVVLTSLIYHLLNGLRHLLWDIGWGFEIVRVYQTGYLVLAMSVLLTVGIWVVAINGGGA